MRGPARPHGAHRVSGLCGQGRAAERSRARLAQHCRMQSKASSAGWTGHESPPTGSRANARSNQVATPNARPRRRGARGSRAEAIREEGGGLHVSTYIAVPRVEMTGDAGSRAAARHTQGLHVVWARLGSCAEQSAARAAQQDAKQCEQGRLDRTRVATHRQSCHGEKRPSSDATCTATTAERDGIPRGGDQRRGGRAARVDIQRGPQSRGDRRCGVPRGRTAHTGSPGCVGEAG